MWTSLAMDCVWTHAMRTWTATARPAGSLPAHQDRGPRSSLPAGVLSRLCPRLAMSLPTSWPRGVGRPPGPGTVVEGRRAHTGPSAAGVAEPAVALAATSAHGSGLPSLEGRLRAEGVHIARLYPDLFAGLTGPRGGGEGLVNTRSSVHSFAHSLSHTTKLEACHVLL